ncbi:hypothetical protein ACP4OV_017972 [Aristida adscensionis]
MASGKAPLEAAATGSSEVVMGAAKGVEAAPASMASVKSLGIRGGSSGSSRVLVVVPFILPCSKLLKAVLFKNALVQLRGHSASSSNALCNSTGMSSRVADVMHNNLAENEQVSSISFNHGSSEFWRGYWRFNFK